MASYETAKIRHAEYFYTVIKREGERYRSLNLLVKSLSVLDKEWRNILLAFNFLQSMIGTDSDFAILCNNFVGELDLYFRLSKHPSEYLTWLYSGIEAARFLKNRQVENNHLGNVSNCYFYMGDYDQALLILEECLLIYQEFGDLCGEARTYIGIGTIYAVKEDRNKAIHYFEKSLKIAESVDERLLIANTLLNLGGVYIDGGKPEDALPILKRSLELFTANNKLYRRIQVINNIATAYILLGENDKAIYHLTSVLPDAEKVGAKREIAHLLGSIGIILLKLRKFDEAATIFDKSLQISLEIGDRRLADITRHNLSILRRQKHRISR